MPPPHPTPLTQALPGTTEGFLLVFLTLCLCLHVLVYGEAVLSTLAGVFKFVFLSVCHKTCRCKIEINVYVYCKPECALITERHYPRVLND